MNVSKIDQFCKLHGLSRTDLEAAAGLSNGAIGKWERSIYGPSISQLLKLAKYFKVTLNELVVYDEEGKSLNEPKQKAQPEARLGRNHDYDYLHFDNRA